MKATRRIDGSICGAIPLVRPSSRSSWPAAAAAVAVGAGLVAIRTANSHYSHGRRGGGPGWVRSYSSSCSASAVGSNTKGQIIRERSSPPAPAHPTFLAHAPPALDINLSKQLQPGSSAAPPEPEPTTTLELSKKELLELLDPYDGGEVEGVDEHLRFFRDPYMRGYAPPDEAAVTVART
jgi:hypothetical protein